jgi:hypothetical protein
LKDVPEILVIEKLRESNILLGSQLIGCRFQPFLKVNNRI